MINCPKEFEPDRLNTFVRRRFKNAKFYKECTCISLLVPALPPRDFALFERQFLLEYYIQEAKHSLITKLHKFFKCL